MAKLEALTEITDFNDIKKLGLDQYSPPICKAVYLGGRLATTFDREKALDHVRELHKGATHFMGNSNSISHAGYISYAFVFYGPVRP